MTTKVLIVNHGPDSVLVRTVQYGPGDEAMPVAAVPVNDTIVPIQASHEFYVHTHQQLLIGEKRPEKTEGQQG